MGLLNMALSGTRDAGQILELTVVSEGGCVQGVFWHRSNDFVMGGTRAGSAFLVEVLRKVFIVKEDGVLGPDTGDENVTTYFSRLLRWRDCWKTRGEANECETRENCAHSMSFCMEAMAWVLQV